jgi:hypothetical protein
MNCELVLLDSLQKDFSTSIVNLINQSGIINNVQSEEIPTLINSISYLKDNVSVEILSKVRGSISGD